MTGLNHSFAQSSDLFMTDTLQKIKSFEDTIPIEPNVRLTDLESDEYL